jgi:hypothetical protein
MSTDPIGERGGINVHGFAANNPLNYVDAEGLEITGGDVVDSIVVLNPLTWALNESAKACRDKARQDARLAFPRDDKKQHCYASCAFNRCMGLLQPILDLLGGFWWELQHPDQGWHDAIQDIKADIYGIVKSYTFQPCKDACNKCPVKDP